MSADLQQRLAQIREQKAYAEMQLMQASEQVRQMERVVLQLQGAEAILLELLKPAGDAS